jgi:hypothetical protein
MSGLKIPTVEDEIQPATSATLAGTVHRLVAEEDAAVGKDIHLVGSDRGTGDQGSTAFGPAARASSVRWPRQRSGR